VPVGGGLHVTRLGAGDRAVFVHGSFAWSEETWAEQTPLAARYELVFVDRRGFGGSPARGRVDFERDARDVAELAEGAHLVGHSYGGVVGLLVAAETKLRSLTLIEPPAFGLVRGDPAVEDLVSRIDEATASARDPGDYRARFLGAFGFSGEPRDLSELELAAARASLGERPPGEAEIPLDAIAASGLPVLVARGAWDEAPDAARLRAGAAFARICDVLEARLDAQSATFAGAAHSPQLLGAPFNERLERFWEAVASRRE
jgi:pimeloyl-ACP methyl ester carboxylesterase